MGVQVLTRNSSQDAASPDLAEFSSTLSGHIRYHLGVDATGTVTVTTRKLSLHTWRVRYAHPRPIAPQKTCIIGCSLYCSPLYVKDHARTLFRQLVEEGYDEVVVLIGDQISRYNSYAFEHKSLDTGNALKHAMEEGDRLITVVEAAMAEELTSLEAERFTVMRWAELHDAEYERQVQRMLEEYESNPHFATSVDEIAKNFMSFRQPNKKQTPKRLAAVGKYVMTEMPLLVNGIGSIPVFVYPTYTKASSSITDGEVELPSSGVLQGVCRMAADIQSSPGFEQLRQDINCTLDQQVTMVDAVFPRHS